MARIRQFAPGTPPPSPTRPGLAPRWRPERWAGPIARLARTEVAGGLVITVAVVAALAWANLAPHPSYRGVWEAAWHTRFLPQGELSTVRQWVDNGLMTIFFFAVGLEIGRERTVGALRDVRNALLPVGGALGGMAGAATVYLVTAAASGAGAATLRGWGVPMATDVAFTLGAMALLGRRVPPALRVFVLALAVADDVGSVVVLAFVASGHVRVWCLVGAIGCVAAAAVLRKRVTRAWWPYVGLAAGGWYLLAWGGVEPSLAGAFVGMLTPCQRQPDGVASSPAVRLESVVAPLSALVVLPLFALANTGIVINPHQLTTGQSGTVFTGVLVARMVGKMAGITAAAVFLVRLRVVRLPKGVRWAQLAGAAVMCGMGFTVPLLFATAAFAGHPALVGSAQVGLLAGTVLAGITGAAVLTAVSSRPERGGQSAKPTTLLKPVAPTGHDTPVP